MSSYGSLAEKLRQGIEAARKGDKVTAQKLLRQVVDGDHDNEVAWMWLASTIDNLNERKQALEQALRINPENTRAQEALNQLNTVLGVSATARKTSSAAPGRASRAPAASPAGSLRAALGDESPAGGRSSGFILIIVGALLAVGVLAAVIFGVINGRQPSPPNAATIAAQQVILNLTLAYTPIAEVRFPTETPFYGVIVTPDNLATLPPSFTPTFTPTPEPSATPTATPFPPSMFFLFFTSLGESGGQPALYRAAGDGTNEIEVGPASAGFDDVAVSPNGQLIAFVRTATYDKDGASVTAPELFVAPAGQPDQARQITQLGGSALSSPTWAPDSIQLMFVSNYDGEDELWTVTEDGNNLRQFTFNEFADRDPAWSPKGDVILYTSEQANRAGSGLTELFTISTDGLTVNQITDAEGSSYSPAWSPDGQFIVFASDRSGDGDIYIAEASGQAVRLLTSDDGGAEDRQPEFIPIGNSLVFLSNRGGNAFQFYMTDRRGSSISRLSDSGRDVLSYAYRPDPTLR